MSVCKIAFLSTEVQNKTENLTTVSWSSVLVSAFIMINAELTHNFDVYHNKVFKTDMEMFPVSEN
jgi:hypothetical protein